MTELCKKLKLKEDFVLFLLYSQIEHLCDEENSEGPDIIQEAVKPADAVLMFVSGKSYQHNPLFMILDISSYRNFQCLGSGVG